MPKLVYLGTVFDCREGETVISAFLRHGVNVPFSCCSGVCHVCLRRCVGGTVPEEAQAGLRQTLRALGYFLPCKCIPIGDMEIAPRRDADLFSPAVVHEKELLAPDVCRVLLEPATPLYYHAGQFINVRRPDGLTRSYSLASIPRQDYFLELHIKRMRNGVMSNWIFEELRVNDEIEIQGPQGSCHYVPGCREQNLLLIGTGTGLAPLVGIVRDALHSGHTGQIYLYHGSRRAAGVYLREMLLDFHERYPNFHYAGCVSGGEAPEGFLPGRAHDVAFDAHPNLSGWRVHLAGLPAMVHLARSTAVRAGAGPTEVHADPFELRDRRCQLRSAERTASWRCANEIAQRAEDPRRDPPPDPEMWAALKEGTLLSEILTDFYTRVFEDPQLAPYFRGVTKRRLIEKVFSFMRQVFTGERMYFGDRPRNAHHWMVISDELFDHREALMESCLRRHRLPGHLIARWRAIEESYRGDIVKPIPWSRIVDGVELPLEGFGEVVLAVGTMCDGCQREIVAGEKVRYHLRLGATYCRACTAREEAGVVVR